MFIFWEIILIELVFILFKILKPLPNVEYIYSGNVDGVALFKYHELSLFYIRYLNPGFTFFFCWKLLFKFKQISFVGYKSFVLIKTAFYFI